MQSLIERAFEAVRSGDLQSLSELLTSIDMALDRGHTAVRVLLRGR
jgi:hypothetical protein